MITYNKTKLSTNEWYEDNEGNILAFNNYRNTQLATFYLCDYNEEKGEYEEKNEIRYLTKNEVAKLRKV